MDAFLTNLSTEGQLDSSGRFTINKLRVSELYENAQKLEPGLYFLKAIQAAVAAGPPRVDVKLLSTGVRIIFSPERSIADDFQALFGDGGGRLADYLRWSVHCALAAGVGSIRCRLSGPDGADRVEFLFRSQGSTVQLQPHSDAVRRVELSFEGFRATSALRAFLGIYERLRIHYAVTRHCGFGLVPIYIDGFLVKPDYWKLVLPKVALTPQAIPEKKGPFIILKLGRKALARPGFLLATPHPLAFSPRMVLGRDFKVETRAILFDSLLGRGGRTFYLTNHPLDKRGLLWEDYASGRSPFSAHQEGDYRGQGTIKLLSAKVAELKKDGSPELFTLESSREFVRHYGLAGSEECLLPQLDRVVAECLVISSLDKGKGSFLCVVRDGVLLSPMACNLGPEEVVAVVADADIQLDASGLKPIDNDHFQDLVTSVRAVVHESRPIAEPHGNN